MKELMSLAGEPSTFWTMIGIVVFAMVSNTGAVIIALVKSAGKAKENAYNGSKEAFYELKTEIAILQTGSVSHKDCEEKREALGKEINEVRREVSRRQDVRGCDGFIG